MLDAFRYLLYTSYYAGIMLDAFRYLLCSKLCWHNRPEPNCSYDYTLEIAKACMSIYVTGFWKTVPNHFYFNIFITATRKVLHSQ